MLRLKITRSWLLFVGLVAGSLGGGCGESPTQVSVARARWHETESTCDIYRYTVTVASVFGSRWETTVEITAGVATRRTFERSHSTYIGSMLGPRVIDSQWTEIGAGIGTHPESEGAAPAKTMEDLYDDCESKVLTQDPARSLITFEADSRGVLQECSFVPHGCADDCTMGVSVSAFDCGPVPLP